MNRKNSLRGLLFVLLSVVSVSAYAQSATALRLNEILVVNNDNYVDHYGKRSPWIEIYNTSAASVNIGGCFLTNDPSNPKKYAIPGGDVMTVIPPHQHVLFWADGEPFHGTFHLNFKLDPSQSNYIALYDADGRTLIDEVTVPAEYYRNQPTSIDGGDPSSAHSIDVSYGREYDGKSEFSVLATITPNSNNKILDSNEKIENFKRNDPYGIVVTLISMFVVFTALALLYIIFRSIGKASVKVENKAQLKREKSADVAKIGSGSTSDNEDAVYAAIAMALYEMSGGSHDDDSMVITINSSRGSAWSSKAQFMKQDPR